MLAVDTNIIIRLITQDEPTQAKRATAVFANNTIFISDSVLLETVWVLKSAYHFSINDITHALRKLLGLPNVRVVQPKNIVNALQWADDGLDIANAFHLATSQPHSQRLVTFDQRFAARNPTNYPIEHLA